MRGRLWKRRSTARSDGRAWSGLRRGVERFVVGTDPPILASKRGRLRRRAVGGALAVAGLAIGILVAMLGWSSPRSHQPTAVDWIVQLIVIVAAVLLVATRVTRKR